MWVSYDGQGETTPLRGRWNNEKKSTSYVEYVPSVSFVRQVTFPIYRRPFIMTGKPLNLKFVRDSLRGQYVVRPE